MSITTSMCTSAKMQFLKAGHNFSAAGGDTFNIALIKATPTGTYSAATTNYANVTSNSDEVTGTGYTAGGIALVNIDPLTSGTSAFTSFSATPTWTTATFSTSGCIIYNTSKSNTAVGVFDFGGVQTVTASTFTVVLPADASGSAIIQIS